MPATANLSGCVSLQYVDDASGQDASSQKIGVFDLLPLNVGEGVSIRSITIQTLVGSGGANLAIAAGPPGSAVTLLSTATVAVGSAGIQLAALTATATDLELDRGDYIEITRSGADSQNRITIECGEKLPTGVPVS